MFKVICNIHITNYKVCAFCVCILKVFQGLLARIVGADVSNIKDLDDIHHKLFMTRTISEVI